MTRRRSFNPVRVILWVAFGAALVLAVGFLYVAVVTPAIVGPIAKIGYTQSKPVPKFDGAERTVTDAATLDDFRTLLIDHHIIPPFYLPAPTDGCAGGTTSKLTITYTDGRTAPLSFYDCGDDGTFAAQAAELLGH